MSEILQHERLTGPVIHSPQSKRVKDVAGLIRRSSRHAVRRFIAEGPQAVREALGVSASAVPPSDPHVPVGGSRGHARSSVVRDLLVTADAADRHPDIIDAAEAAGVAARQIAPVLLERLSDAQTSQGMVAVCDFIDVDLDSAVRADSRLIVVLSQVRDPGNAGAVLRVADAAGADAVVYTSSSVDIYNPKAVRASAGSIFHLPIVTGAPLEHVVSLGRARGHQVLAADAHPPAHDLHDPWATGLDLSAPTMWVFGNEAWGLPESDRGLCDSAAAVPIYGDAESLNLAVAAGICIYESARALRA